MDLYDWSVIPNPKPSTLDFIHSQDWSVIHEEMQTDRSIKQLQDHWNDTKNARSQAK